MHYTEYFSMCHYAGFSQIGSHIITPSVSLNVSSLAFFLSHDLLHTTNGLIYILSFVKYVLISLLHLTMQFQLKFLRMLQLLLTHLVVSC